ncbi:hypothetical protein C7974DRAFT_415687 [Boeremia exigua]|uniref:uncharacterized protein n=1 Tax=Boeremia exigua TaxID=749465 RepID=UPI001E8E18E3|nr:uncharacterized protein C7974DRAFT_415687 [Boeremia exigua]KAH6620482.1 hypothetical protein C7974DRAFT_415687 [Boeremia exigua]
MSYATQWKESDGDFLLVVAGLTRYAPYLTGWQEFKDHIRKVVKEQPGWVDVYASQSQRRGEMQGWCRLKDKQDADAAYKTFYRSKGMLVHVWQTRRSNEGFRLMECNCSVHFLDLPEGDHSPGLCGIDIGRVNQLGGQPYAVPPTQYMPVQPGYPYSTYSSTTSYPVPPVYATQAPMMPQIVAQPPVYSASNNGMPVNIRDGAMLTEARGIFIQNLSYKVGSDELKSLLYSVGRPVDCKVHRDRSGVSKGVATAKFASTHEAQLAVTHLNRKSHRGMTLKVRLDQATTVVGQVGPPLVVNGSVGAYSAGK